MGVGAMWLGGGELFKLYMDRFWGGVGGQPAIDPLSNDDDAAGVSELVRELLL